VYSCVSSISEDNVIVENGMERSSDDNCVIYSNSHRILKTRRYLPFTES
jgi:hypothetical protein